jgi:hypothetical protein
MKTRSLGLILVGLLVLLAVSPLLPPGLPSIADAPIHLFRTMEMVSVWADGIYYPRWAPNLALGYGYPLFDFAPPLPYFIAGAFHVLGFSLETSIKLLAILCMAFYGVGMYLFVRNVLGERGALLAAAAYLYAPFRFREILLYGGNYPQILAIGLFPWVLWAFERIIADGRSRYIVAGAICYGALILSHNFHAFIFTPLLLLYIAVETLFVKPRSDFLGVRHAHVPNGATSGDVSSSVPALPGLSLHRGRIGKLLHKLWRSAVALSLGLALTAFFWVPALHDLQYTFAQADYYLTRSDFRLRLLSLRDLLAVPIPLDGRADNPDVPFSLGIVIVVLAVLGVAYLLVAALCLALSASQCARPGHMWREVRHLAFFLVVLLGASFMMLRPAALLWETLPFLPYAEFPWRLMGIANLAAAFLAGGSIRLGEWAAELRGGRSWLADLALAMSILGLILGVAVYFYPTKSFQRWGTPTLSDYIGYEVYTHNLGTTGLAEYLPKWAEEIPTSSPLVNTLREGGTIEKLDRSALPAGVQATALAHSSTEDRYRFNSENSFRARFFTFYFPGWRAFLDGEPVPIRVTSPLGLMVVDVPAGDHELLLRFGETPFRLAMDVISMLALAGIAGWSVSRGWSVSHGWSVSRVIGQLRQSAVQKGDDLAADARSTRLEWRQVWPLGILLAVVFFGKVSFVDPHTTWFRQESPPDQVAGAQYPMRVLMQDNVLFLGYDLVGSEMARGGELLQVRLYWQATGPLSGDYISFIHLDAPPDNTTFATSDNYQPGDPQAQIDMPSRGWKPELYVRDEHRLELPDEIPPIAYELRVGLYDRETGQRLSILPGQGESQGGDTIFLQKVYVLPAQTSFRSMIQSRQSYHLGESIELLGYSVESEPVADDRIQPGQTVTVTLFWQALEPVGGDYTVFVQLLDEAGQVADQHDGPPVNGRYPTHGWLPGQVVEDKTVLALAPDLPNGEYRIAVGMYELETGQRLKVKGKNGSVPGNAILLEPVLQVGR